MSRCCCRALRLEVEGTGNAAGQFIAQKVLLTSVDLQAAREIQAGTAPLAAQQQLSAEQQKLTQQQLALQENEAKNEAATDQAQQSVDLANQRIDNLNKYATKYKTGIYFGMIRLLCLRRRRPSLTVSLLRPLNQRLHDSDRRRRQQPGSCQLNEELSDETAHAVIARLTRSGHIPLFREFSSSGNGRLHRRRAAMSR
jgi:hypothetical protein